jgi:hypothetical protein
MEINLGTEGGALELVGVEGVKAALEELVEYRKSQRHLGGCVQDVDEGHDQLHEEVEYHPSVVKKLASVSCM